MPVPLEDYHVREKGVFSYDSLTSVAKKYNTTPAAIKYFNRNRDTYDKIKDLSTGEGLLYMSAFNKIDPAEIPILSVPQRVSGGSSTNKQAGSVSTTTNASFVSKRIILKRINASYWTAIKDNLPVLGSKKSSWQYFWSSEVEKYHEWSPLVYILAEMQQHVNNNPGQDPQQQGWELYQIFKTHINTYAKVLRVEETETGRMNYFAIANSNNPAQTPPDSDKDKKKVLEIIEKLVDLDNQGDSYGHWWLEIYDGDIDLPPATIKDFARYLTVVPSQVRASYGFWPVEGAGLKNEGVFGSGVKGGINRKDPFDLNDASHQYDPYAKPADGYISWKVDYSFFATDPYGRTEGEIYNDILEYISNYPVNMKWAWPDSGEEHQHCQTFQKELLAACGLVAAPNIPKDRFPPLDKYGNFWGPETLP